jgi:ubiquinone/menaquinone biosynthesis C-methylase UbiE
MHTAAVRAPVPARAETAPAIEPSVVPAVAIPPYLSRHYWWAYIDPRAIRFFDRQWIINLILWGNYAKLRDAALAVLGDALSGKTLQVACAYGDLTPHLSHRVSAGEGRLDVVDVVPAQLGNVRRKLPPKAPVRLLVMDSSNLKMPDASYDRAIVYLLFHEQPQDYRARTLAEIFRVVKPGGKIVIVDYARPRWWNPIRYLLGPILYLLEPFALDLWRAPLSAWMPAPWSEGRCRRDTFFGGVYQRLVLTR